MTGKPCPHDAIGVWLKAPNPYTLTGQTATHFTSYHLVNHISK